MLLIPLSEALELPGKVERANNAEASRRICYTSIPNARAPDADGIYISTKTSTVCYILDFTIEFSRLLIAKKERRVNAFVMSADPPA